jgi:hypothetical protein
VSGSTPSATTVRSLARRAYCPLCGYAHTKMLVSDVRGVEDALCPGRCADAWHALAALRLRESVDERVSQRRRAEYASGEAHPSALSELLLARWRAGDWSVSPEDLLNQVRA